MSKCIICGSEVDLKSLRCTSCNFDHTPRPSKELKLRPEYIQKLKEFLLETIYKGYNPGKKKIEYSDLVTLWENGYKSTKEIPLCKICKQRPVTVNRGKIKETCSNRSCISKHNMKKQGKEKLREMQRKALEVVKEKYGVDNIAKLKSAKIIKSEKQKDIWKEYEYRKRRANSLFKKLGVFNRSQLSLKKELHKVLSKYGCQNAPDIYECYLKNLYKKLKSVGLINVNDYRELAFKLSDGNNTFEFKCPKCGLVFKKYFQSPIKFLLGDYVIRCPSCYSSRSTVEEKLVQILKPTLEEYGLKIETNVKKFTYPREIDIVIFDNNGAPLLGIEVDGLYYHSTRFIKALNKNISFEEFKEEVRNFKERLIEKLSRLSKLNFKTLIFTDFDIIDKPNIVLNKIFLELKLKDKFKRIPARELVIKEISGTDARKFLEKYHINGYGHNTEIKLGAFDKNNELIAVMTVSRGKNRKTVGSDNIVRYAPKNFVMAPGLLSKFITYLRMNYNFEKIKYWVDLCYSGINSSQPFNGALSYKIIDWENKKIYHRIKIRDLIKKSNFNGTELEFIYKNKNFDIYFIPAPIFKIF